jgi:mono/diheme cytochrome c family protein
MSDSIDAWVGDVQARIAAMREARARYVASRPPPEVGFVADVRQETLSDCSRCHGVGYFAEPRRGPDGRWSRMQIEECPCTRWVRVDHRREDLPA